MTFDYSLFDTLLEPLFVISKDHKVVYCNETSQVLCGLTLRKIQRLTFDELFTFSEKLEWLDKLEEVKDPTPYREVRFKTSEGQEGRVQITCREFPTQGADRHWIIFVRDVTLEERLQNKYRGELEQKEGYIEELKKAQAELEQYSKNLEKMVEERTREITRLNQQMKALLDSLNQGFFIYGKDGKCFEVTSRACESVIEGNPAGKNIWDVLKIPTKKVEGFKKWMTTVFDELLPFPDLVALAPQSFSHTQGHAISLEYFPLRSDQGKIDGVVVVASDITSLVEAQKQAAVDREYAQMIIKLVKNKKEISRFIREAQSLLNHLKTSLKKPTDGWSREELYRILHTVKGGSASFSVSKTAELCHQAEQLLTEYKSEPTPQKAETLREKCQQIEASFQEYIHDTKNILGEKGLSETRFIEMPVPELLQLVQQISHWSKGEDLAYHLLKSYIMEPIGSFFEPYKELIQTVAQKESKLVEELKLHNEKLPVLPEVYSPLLACLVHAFRNGIDHGIEAPEVRQAAGKPEAGKMDVYFEVINRDREILQIRIVDDGGGINPDRIRKKLEEKGISVGKETNQQIIQHIFDSEFSTRDVVTETSGRGVGMDAILNSAKALGGNAWVESVQGKGTSLFIEVPYVREAPAPHRGLTRVA
jgi:two-component system chemotaxis sensor kinase CheA